MIVWGWRHHRQKRSWWAHRLHTTTSGVDLRHGRVVSQSTGWDKPSHAGPYIVLDIGHYSFEVDAADDAPHPRPGRRSCCTPILLRVYPYLDDDASGHYQVGRGYQNAAKPDQLGCFEPWNPAVRPSGPTIDRVQWRDAYPQLSRQRAHYIQRRRVMRDPGTPPA